MPLSLQEISDRMEIQDLLYEYADIIDQKRFDDLSSVFTEDAYIDYSAAGGSKGNIDETIAFLKMAMPMYPNCQHLNGNMQINVDGDTATGRVMCFNPMEMKIPNQKPDMMFVGIWYIDEYVRADGGWKIKRRSEELSFLKQASGFGQ